MPAAHPPEFRRRALDLVAQGNPVAQTARDLGVSESCLRNWMSRDEIDSGRKPGLTTEERKELIERAPKIGFRLVQELAADGVPVAVACRFLKVSTSGYYEWVSRPPSSRAVADEALTTTIRRVHHDSAVSMGHRGCGPSYDSAWASTSVRNVSPV